MTQLPSYSITKSSSFWIFSTAFVTTSSCEMVVFLCSPAATRGVDPARSWRARAPAVTTNSNELESLLRSIMKCPNYVVGVALHPPQARPFGDDDAAQPIDGLGQLVVDHHEVVLREGGDLVPRHLQAPLNLRFAVLASPAQPLLE